MKSFANTGLRKRFIISFILVSIIPALIVQLLYIPIINLFKREAIKADALKTNTIQVAIDERSQEIYNLSVQISTNRKVTEFLYKELPLNNIFRYYIRDLVDYIKSCKAGNNYVSLIALYLVNSSSVVTHEGVYNSDYFFENIMKYEGIDAASLKQMMNKTYYNEYMPLKEIKGKGPLNGRYITYLQTVPIGDSQALANIIMLINEKDILAFTGEMGDGDNHKAMILTDSGQVIVSTADDDLRTKVFNSIENNEGYFIEDLSGQDSLLVTYAKSKVNKWTYIVLSSMDSVLSRINIIRHSALLATGLSLGIAVLLSILMAGSNYKPWAMLLNEMKQFGKPASAHTSENEYLIAMNTIYNIKAEREKMQRDIKESDSQIKRYKIQDLCLGNLSSIDIQGLEENFPFKYFCVIMVDLDENISFLKRLNTFLVKLVSIYFKNSIIFNFIDTKERLCIVLNTSLPGNSVLLAKLRRLERMISQHFDVLLYVGVGGVYRDLDKVHTSYTEAIESLDYCLLKGTEPVVFYPEIQKYIFSYLNIPVHSDNPLLNSVKAGDIKSCTKLLDEYFSNIADTGAASIQYMYCLFYNFVSVILKACSEMQVDFKDVFEQTPQQILDIGRYRSSKQIIDGIYNVYIIMCEYVQDNKKSQNAVLKERVSAYIKDHYTSQDMSLVNIAEALGYSSSYLSRFIKQEFGIGFGDLLNKIRLDHAKALLVTGSKTISEISEIVGYSSVNSFTRAFKREEGITPSQYGSVSSKQTALV